jgi:hypothetical protein
MRLFGMHAGPVVGCPGMGMSASKQPTTSSEETGSLPAAPQLAPGPPKGALRLSGNLMSSQLVKKTDSSWQAGASRLGCPPAGPLPCST